MVLPDVALHIVQRGVARAETFFEDKDYQRYLALLGRFARESGCALHAYCLMTNHVHLLMTPPDAQACARLMKHLNQCYVQALNRSRNRNGPLWAGRFYSALVTSDRYALTCHRYIELNPVRGGMVAHPRDYPWSSYRANAEGQGHGLLQAHPTYAALSARPEERSSAYRTLFDGELPAADVEAIRRATRGGCRIGEPPKRRGPKKKKD